MNVLALARPDIRALEPYSSARMEASAGDVFLNANESPWPPFADGAPLNRYPDPQPARLVARLADLHGVNPTQLLVGRGSDEGIDLLVRAFCRADRDAVLVSPPTFGMYAVCARVQGAGVVEVPLAGDFTLDPETILARITPPVKLVFVCSPNNPTGTAVPRAVVAALAEALAGRALLVVDEAYVEFAADGASVADLVGRIENLVVLRTLSKAFALAGARVGVLLADARIVNLLRRIMPPYPLPQPCIELAMRAVSGQGVHALRERVARVRRGRAWLREALEALGCVREVLPSEANFLAVRFADPDAAWAALRARGIVVRDLRRYPRLDDAFRITVGNAAENRAVVDALRECVRSPARAQERA